PAEIAEKQAAIPELLEEGRAGADANHATTVGKKCRLKGLISGSNWNPLLAGLERLRQRPSRSNRSIEALAEGDRGRVSDRAVHDDDGGSERAREPARRVA